MSELAPHEYREGPWTAVAGDRFVALVAPEAPARVVDGLWQVAHQGGDVLGALGVVAADGFAALPRFAVVRTEVDGAVHAVLRGPVRLRLHGTDDVQEVAAGDGAVWTEHRAVGVRGAALVVDEAAPGASPWWPLVAGVVRAGELRTGRTTDAGAVVGTATHEQPAVAAVPTTAAPEPAPAASAAPVPVVPVHATPVDVVPDAPTPVDVVPDAPAPVTVEEPVTAGGLVVDASTDVGTASDVAPGSLPDAAPATGAGPEEPTSGDEPAADVDVPAPAADEPAPSDATEGDPAPLSAWEAAAPTVVEQDTPAADVAVEPPAEAAPSIPWWPLGDDAVVAPSEPVAAPEEPAAAPQEPVPAAVATALEQAVTDVEVDPLVDDHDGMTILSSDLARLRDRLPTWTQDAVPGPFATPEPAPLAARLVLSTGLVVALDRAVLLGRAPQVARVTNRELPRLVTVPSPNQDISRTHAEVRVDGDHVVVTDLDSTNGVHVSRPGEGVRRLHPGEPSVVGTDEVVDLGDGVTFTVERSA